MIPMQLKALILLISVCGILADCVSIGIVLSCVFCGRRVNEEERERGICDWKILISFPGTYIMSVLVINLKL